MGYMTAEDMQARVTEQIQAIIYSLFLWRSGDWKLEPHEDPVDEAIRLNLSTADIILGGTRRMDDSGAIRRARGPPAQAGPPRRGGEGNPSRPPGPARLPIDRTPLRSSRNHHERQPGRDQEGLLCDGQAASSRSASLSIPSRRARATGRALREDHPGVSETPRPAGPPTLR